MKGLCIVQYYPYQYDQYKFFAEKLGLDMAYRHDIREGGDHSSKSQISIIEGDTTRIVKFSDSDFFKNYDFLMYTGPSCISLDKLALSTRKGKIFYSPHSLIGTIYDSGISMSCSDNAIGFIPRCWSEFSSYHTALDRFIEGNGKEPNVVFTKTHPMLVQVYNKIPNFKIDDKSIGVILGHRNPFQSYKNLVDEYSAKNGISKIRVRFHMLSYPRYYEFFNDEDYIRSNPFEEDKYDFTDSCGTLVSAPSSLLVESYLRSKYYQTGQNVLKFPDQRGVISCCDSITGIPAEKPDVYDDFIVDAEDVVDEYRRLIESNL